MIGPFSKSFLKFAGRLSLAGVIVLAGFWAGTSYFMVDAQTQTQYFQVKTFAANINQALSKDMVLYIQDQQVKIPRETLFEWQETYRRAYSNEDDVRIDDDKLTWYLKTIAPEFSKEPVNGRFSIGEDGRVQEFAPYTLGYHLDIDASVNAINLAMMTGQNEVVLPVVTVEPEISLEKINNLGITTLIGHGESDFTGSSASRIHNVKFGASKYNGLLVGPGEEFSFNDILGEVDVASGFKAELVIKSGKLVYEAGGGICQVSTTLFRAAINAGFPILERRPHSMAVRYYNPQGFDATIYPGVVDLRFKNDSPNHILIQSYVTGTKLTFDIYGTDDGREVMVSTPVQYAQQANGALKAYFIREIYRDGVLAASERFDSSYGPPAQLERNPLE